MPQEVTDTSSAPESYAIQPLPQAAFCLDQKGTVLDFEAYSATGAFAELPIRRGLTAHRCLHPDCVDGSCVLLRLIATGLGNARRLAIQEWDLPAGTGQRTFRIHMRRSFEGSSHGYVVLIVTDITEGRELSRMLRATNESLTRMLKRSHLENSGELKKLNHSLRTLSGELIIAQESERRRIAAELHDGLGQWLSLAKMSLETAMQDIHEAKPAAQVGRAFEHVRTAIAEVRSIVQNLRPSMLEEFGLVATLELLCHELEVSNPTVEVNCVVEDRHAKVSTPLCVAMVRILQEALMNAAKHSGATQVDVKITLDPEAATLAVTDNGSGFDATRLPAKGFGLSSMKDRGRQSGGLVQFHSVAGKGTTVEVRWDLDPSDLSATSGTHKAIRYGVSGDGSSVPQA